MIKTVPVTPIDHSLKQLPKLPKSSRNSEAFELLIPASTTKPVLKHVPTKANIFDPMNNDDRILSRKKIDQMMSE